MNFYNGQCDVSTTGQQTFIECAAPSSTATLVANGIEDPEPLRLELCKEQGPTTTCHEYEFALMRMDDLLSLSFLTTIRSTLPTHYQAVVEDMTEFFDGHCAQSQATVRTVLVYINSRICATLSSQPEPEAPTAPVVRRLRVCPLNGGGCGSAFLFSAKEESFATALEAARP